ncbi:LuxR C-terminal-related transcriptional regulator [Ferrovibrio sp.]|uniref:response regulator transcription factor n=1 Tax=Ferrovibrio sp. TaxID=1917215 RepID=UPI001B76FB9D|nr:LuxR C-terminal-related transcriptional regulator [Ferrovibrio sp.]MBP7062553.1 response regulator transcription factor [Ferrovibrio sp.]
MQSASEAGQERENPARDSLAHRLHIREIQIVRLIGHGLGNREIAERLALSVQTVKWYNKSLFQKLKVGSRSEALSAARASGLI